MLWTGRIETMMDGWVKYGRKHAFNKAGYAVTLRNAGLICQIARSAGRR